MRRLSPRAALLAALALALFATLARPAPAAADAGAKIWNQDASDHGFHIDFHAGFAVFGRGVAAGVRFNIPLVKKGFLRGHNDAFYLSLGVDSYWVRYWGGPDRRYEYGFGVGFPVVAHWEFYLWEKLSFFGEVGGNVFLHPGVFRDEGDFVDEPGAWIVGAAGVRWRFSDRGSFVARLGTPYTSIGVSLMF